MESPNTIVSHDTERIGRTPMLELRRLERDLPAKLECLNPMSVETAGAGH